MIKKITFKNFFSFCDTEIDLADENILIGINGSGKTNFLRAMELLKATANGGLKKLIFDSWGGRNEILFAGNSSSNRLMVRFEFDARKLSGFGMQFRTNPLYQINLNPVGGPSNYSLEERFSILNEGRNLNFFDFHNGDGYATEKTRPEETPRPVNYKEFDPQESAINRLNEPDRFFPISTLKKAIDEIAYYGYLDTQPSSGIRKPVISTSEKRLYQDGSNLTQILNTLGLIDRNTIRRIKEKIKDVNPNFEDINFNFLGGNIELMLSEAGLNRSIHVSKISDGTLQFLCLLAVFYNPNRGKLICIDEPEIGLHPDIISVVADGIKYAAQTSQMIITTHSDHLLNHFALSNIMVFKKDERNATIVKRLTEEEYGSWLDDYTIGDLWRKGVIGGNRW